ncbi:unnamed protein product [Prunus armeniaca]
MSIILSTITSIIAIVVAWYNETYLVKEPSRDYDQERRCYLNRMYNRRENCIWALDGTHIPVTVSVEERPRYRNRKWKGYASDAHVLRDALAMDNPFQVPSDKYYIVDAGYANGQEGNANRITSVQVTDQWTTFRGTLALQMFHDYQARGATIS